MVTSNQQRNNINLIFSVLCLFMHVHDFDYSFLSFRQLVASLCVSLLIKYERIILFHCINAPFILSCSFPIFFFIINTYGVSCVCVRVCGTGKEEKKKTCDACICKYHELNSICLPLHILCTCKRISTEYGSNR